MTDYVELAKQAMERPSDFGWFGDDDMFVTWGMTGPSWAINSDDILAESNLEAFKKMAHEKFGSDEDYLGDNFDVVGIKHFAVGSLDMVITRIIKQDNFESNYSRCLDKTGEVHKNLIVDSDLTEEFKWVCDLLIGLRENHPVLDEEDFSEREYDAAYDSFVDRLPSEVDAEKVEDVVEWLHVDGNYIDDGTVDEEDIFIAAYAVGADDRKYAEDEWKAWELFNPGPVARRYAGRWCAVGQLKLEV